MDKIKIVWYIFSLSFIALGLFGWQHDPFTPRGILKISDNFIIAITPFTATLIGISGLIFVLLYEFQEKFVINTTLRQFLVCIFIILFVLYVWEAIWHTEMAFSMFVINNGKIDIGSTRSSQNNIPEERWAKFSLFEALWAVIVVMCLYRMKTTKKTLVQIRSRI